MTQKEFMRMLDSGMTSLPKRRRQEIQEDLQQHFNEGYANGAEEAQLADMLGDPTALAKEYTELYLGQNPHPRPSVFKMIWRGVGLFFFNLMIMLPAWIAVFCLWLIPAMGVVIGISGCAMLLGVLVHLIAPNVLLVMDYPLICFVGSFFAMSLGGLMSLAAIWLGKRLVVLFKHYILWNGRVVTGRRSAK